MFDSSVIGFFRPVSRKHLKTVIQETQIYRTEGLEDEKSFAMFGVCNIDDWHRPC